MGSYLVPEPAKEPIKALVIYYKVFKGFEYDDKLWDREWFPRSMLAAKKLIEICKSFDAAKTCIEQLASSYDEKELGWTLETIARNAHEWMLKRGGKDANKTRKRLHDALIKQRADGAIETKGRIVTAGEMLGSIGNLEIILAHNGNKDGSPDTSNGEPGERVQQMGLEAKES
jgi:hypothetical protein